MMDWSVILEVNEPELEEDVSLQSSLYEFVVKSDLPSKDHEPANFVKYLSVLRELLKLKYFESKNLEEDFEDISDRLNAMESNINMSSEKDLLEKLAAQDKEIRLQHAKIHQLQEEVGVAPPSATNEIRKLREELEDLKHENTGVKRSLEYEKAETDRLTHEGTAEKLRTRQLERRLEELQATVDDYHGQVQRAKGKVGVDEDNNYRQKMIEKEMEFSKLLDDFQLMANSFEETKSEVLRLSVRLEKIEEERIATLNDCAQMRQALAVSDLRCEELEARNSVLEARVSDLQEKLNDQSGADQQIMTMITNKAKEWESVLSSKQSGLDHCQDRIQDLEGQLRVAQRQTDRATQITMKKRLQNQEKQLSNLQKELSESVKTNSNLTDQLEEAKRKSNEGPIVLQRMVEGLEVRGQQLERELIMEVERRKKAEISVEEKQVELTSVRKRMWDYENNVFGLREAVETIKKKKEELTVRDNDIADMTRQVNHLESILNQLSEENEALRDQLGLGGEESVNLSPFRRRKQSELEQLRKHYKQLENEAENLKEDNLSLRKQLVQVTMSKIKADSTDGRIGDQSNDGAGQSGLVQELRSRVDQLESLHEREKGQRKEWEMERERLERIIRERNDDQEAVDGSSEEVIHQLQTDLSVLTGQNKELRGMLLKADRGAKEAEREMERKQHLVNSLEREVLSLKRSKAGFQSLHLPEKISPTPNDVITSLNEHLLQVLKALHQREKEVGIAQEALEKFQRKFSVIIHQQGVLYKEYSDARRTWELEINRLTEENKNVSAVKEQAQIYSQQLKSLHDQLTSDPDDLKQKMAEQSRKMTLLIVNERTLSRKFSLVENSETYLRRENTRLNQDLVTLERAVAERIGYLQRHKEASIFQLSSLQSQLSESVPMSLLNKANREHSDLLIKYQELLQKQTSYTSTTTTIEHLQAEVKTLSEQLISVKQDLHTEKQKRPTAPTSPSAQHRGVENRDVTQRITTLEMKELNERQRADLASARCRQLQDTVLQLEQRNSSLEEKFSDLSQRLLHSQSREAGLRDQVACSLPERDKTSLESHISKLSESESQLQLENSKLKDVADVAWQQAVAMEMKQKSYDIEVSSLRHQLLDLQMKTGDRTMLGKLHHQLVALQVSKASAVKKYEEERTKVSKLEAGLLRCEQQRDMLNETVFRVRAESQNRLRNLRCTIQELRRQFAGCLPLCEQERHARTLHELAEDKREAERMREDARKSMEASQDKFSELKLQHANLQELLGTLREHSKDSVAVAKLAEWHAKLGEVRLTEMRTNRTNDRLKEKVKHLEGLLKSSEGSFGKLERDLVQITKEYELSQISWEQQEMKLENELEEAKREKREMWTAAGTNIDQPDTGKPGAETLCNLHLQTDATSKLEREVQQHKEHAERLDRALAETQRVLLEREKEVTNLKLQRDVQFNHAPASATLELEKKLEVTMETLEQLKVELIHKERQTDKYQRLLQETRQELKDHTLDHKRELQALTEKLHTHSDSSLSRLKEAAMAVANLPQPELPNDRQLDRLQELENLKADQEQLIARLRRQVEDLKEALERAEHDNESDLLKLKQNTEDKTARHHKVVKDLQSSLEEKSSRVIELEQELEVLDGELSAAQQAAKQAPSRTMKALVERLRNQLSLREKQQRALSQALLQVRADLVETAQRTVEEESSREIQEANIKQLVDKRTSHLEKRISEMSQEQADLTHQLEDSQSQRQGRQAELSVCRKDLKELKSQVVGLTNELEQRNNSLEQGKSRERKMASEIQKLHTKLEQSHPEVEELQKRVRILQGRLEKHKSKASNEISRLTSAKAPGSKKEEGSVETTPQVDDKHKAVEVLKWEESKKWQKKVDTLKSRLTDKHKELEGALKSVHSLKEMLGRTDREKGILQGKLRTAQKLTHSATPNDKQDANADTSRSEKQHSEEKYALQTKVYLLDDELTRLKREVNVGKDSEVFEMKMRCEQLTKSVETLEEQLQQQHPDKSKQLLHLRERERHLEEGLLQSQRECTSLRFDYEQAVLELPRLRDRVRDQQEYIEVLQRSDGAGITRLGVQGNSKECQPGSHTVSELERVINAMRKVIDKLQGENDSLKTKAKNNQSKSRSSINALEEENKRLKTELASVTGAGSPILSSTDDGYRTHNPPRLKSPYSKIVTENERLRRELKKEQEQIDKLNLSLSSLELQNQKLKQDFDSTNKPATPHVASFASSEPNPSYEEKLVRLETELEKKTNMLFEVKKLLREAAEREKQLKSLSADPNLPDRYLDVIQENELLQEQVTQLKKELNAFDVGFFEEIEDLKYNYQEAVRKNIQFEEQIKRMSEVKSSPLIQHPNS